jgi:hypothetical protein
MVAVKEEITKEEYEKAKEKGAYSLFDECMLMGYGVYGAEVYERDGKYWLSYSRGSSCD